MNDVLKKISGDEFVQPNYGKLETSEIKDSSLQIMLNRAQSFKVQQAHNDNNDNNDGGDDTPPPSSGAKIAEAPNEEVDSTSYVVIDVEEVAKHTSIPKQELELICSGNNTAVTIPTDTLELSKFITIQEGLSKTADALANKKILPPEARNYFLSKAQGYGYLWLKAEVQLGNKIRKIESKQGSRSDLKAANDNIKRKTANLDDVLQELRSKKEILAEDYKIGYGQARQLARLTNELVEKELDYAVKNNDTLSRSHAISFLNQPAELSDEEKEATDSTKIKAKFKFDTDYADCSFEDRKSRKTVEPIKYCSLFSCIGSGEFYLDKHGFKCVLANEMDSNRAKYFKSMFPDEDTKMIVGDFRQKFDELADEFTKQNCSLLLVSLPCQTFCAQRGKDWRDDERLTLVLDFMRFVKKTRPDGIVVENAKEFFGFSLPLFENLDAHPIAQQLQTELTGRTMGDYLRDELTASGLEYNLNFAIEDGCYYGTAQSRVRSILLASRAKTWNFPKPEEFAMPLWQAIGHLPSLESGEDSGINYHKAPNLAQDEENKAKIANVLAHTGTGRKSQDNNPKYQLSGFGFFGAKGARKFWDLPSNTIDSGSGSPLTNRTVHPGRLRKDGTYSDARVLTLLEVFLTNGLENYEVPLEFRDKESFVREVMGEIFLPRMLERICLEIPLLSNAWT